MQALISINAVPGSDDDLPLATPVQLDNVGTGGETTYAWSLLAIPEGSAAVLSSASVHNPLFTPDLEGTYLIQVIVNGVMTNRAVVGCRQIKTRWRVPAPGETIEDSVTTGWATAMNRLLGCVDAMRASPTKLVGTCDTGGLAVDSVAAQIGGGALLNGEMLPVYTQINAASPYPYLGLPLYVVDGKVAEAGASGAAAAGDLAQVSLRRVVGPFVVPMTPPAIGAPVYLSNAGLLELAPGTTARRVGHVIYTESVGGGGGGGTFALHGGDAPLKGGGGPAPDYMGSYNWYAWFDGTACAHLDETQAFVCSQGTVPVPLTPAAYGVVTIDAALSNCFTLLLTEDVFFAPPIHMYPGWSCSILVTQDGYGGWSVTADPIWCVRSEGPFTMTPGHSDVITAITFEGVYLRAALMSDRTYVPPS